MWRNYWQRTYNKICRYGKVEFRERTYFPFRNIDFNLDINKLIEHGLYIPNVLLKEGLTATYKWFSANKPKMHDRK